MHDDPRLALRGGALVRRGHRISAPLCQARGLGEGKVEDVWLALRLPRDQLSPRC